MDLHQIVDKGNYIEFILSDDTKTRTEISPYKFYGLLTELKQKLGNCFQKHFKEYVFRDMFYENNDKHQIKVYKKHLTNVHTDVDGLVILTYYKEKLPFHMFPSTSSLHSVCYVSKVVFKITNRLFINFEKRVYNDKEAYHKIFVNYNHEENVDISNLKSTLSTCLEHFGIHL